MVKRRRRAAPQRRGGCVLISLLRDIRSGRGRFVSILAIVAIGVGFFGGVRAAGPDMRLSADTYYRENRLMDFRLVSTLGFSQQDVQALQALPGVHVEPGWSLDCLQDAAGVQQAVRVASLEDTAAVNQVQLVWGRMPQADDECLTDAGDLLGEGGQGGTIRLTGDGDDLSQQLANTTFTIVGGYQSPLYVDASTRGSTTVGDGSISRVLLVPRANFLSDAYTQIYLRVDGLLEAAAYSEEYDALRDAFVPQLESLAAQRTPLRLVEVRRAAAAAIADGERTLADAKAQLEEGERELADARAQLADAKAQLEEGEETLAATRAQLDDARAQLEEGQQALNEQINAAWRQYDAGLAEYRAARAPLEEGLHAAAEALRTTDKAAAFDALRAAVNAADWAAVDREALRQAIQRAPGLADEQRARLLEVLEGTDPADVAPALLAALDELEAADWDAGAMADALEGLANEDDPAQELAQLERLQGLLDTFGPLLPADTADELRQLLAGVRELAQAKQTLDASAAAISDAQAAGQRTIDDKRLQLEAGERDWAAGKAQLEQARAAWQEGEQEYARSSRDAQPRLRQAREEIADGEKELADARAQMEQLELPQWYIFTRADAPGYTEYGENAQRIANIAKLFPVLFLLVAALVSLTTMSRLVEEQRTQIGTWKALGYTDGVILARYMAYALTATLLGSALGLAVGFQLFPRVIIGAYGILYRIPVRLTPFRWSVALGATGAAVACVALTVWASCAAACRQVPAQLMRPRAPAQGKTILLERIGWLWRRLDFLHKVSARNIFRYKKRMLMVLIGISGCTALMVTGFALKGSINDIVNNQFGLIWRYQAVAAVEEQQPQAAAEALHTQLCAQDPQAQVLLTMQMTYTGAGPSGRCEVTVLVPQSMEELPQYIRMQHRRSGETITPAPGQVIITEKMSQLLGVGAGDELQIQNDNGVQVRLRVDAVTENYVRHYVYMDADTFRAAFGAPPTWNTALCRYTLPPTADESALAAELLAQPGVAYVSLLSQTASGFADMINVLDLVVVVLILSAGALAFVVLYDLTSINITERLREIATLKVLGFTDREVSMYIFRENLVLTLLGALAGLALGRWMAMMVITTAEIDVVMFGRTIAPVSYLLAFGITMLFGVVVSVSMHRSLRRIDMVESLKSVE